MVPEAPSFTTSSEREVWELLREQLGDDDLLISGQRISARDKDHEIDICVAFADAGIVVVEVKGGQVWYDDGWWIDRRGREDRIDPITQAREAQYALRGWLDRDPRWGSRSGLRWGHALVLPHTKIAEDFGTPDAQRWQVAGRDDMDGLADFLRRVVTGQTNNKRMLTLDDVDALREALAGRGLPQRDLIGFAAERDDEVERLSAEQAVILRAARLLNRVEVRGGAGSGKTWLAVEQARRLSREGKRVALTCYSRGLAAWLERRVATLPRRERPAYVGTFHNLGVEWGAPTGSEDDSHFWEVELPTRMVDLGREQPEGRLYDALVIDEAQDFADLWWPAALAALKDEETGGLFVCTDEGQRVFSRYGGPPPGLVPLVLDQNLRNTRQIAESFSTLAPIRMRLGTANGPDVTFVECPTTDALDVAEDHVDWMLDAGWRPEDLALLTTGSRSAEQRLRQEAGADAYWSTFWDHEQVFYGHVLGFKGLERPAVILALNETTISERSKERLYVGLSRARDQLLVVGDPDFVAEVGGPAVLRHLRGG
ncbi:nuclease-related domain-containing DEAD/DEAH box helicase [Nocardioides iriomotensis]|uniref:Nuclease n=1 Tax=Nocardioides iriomotensis TaxID=715784 RepID=A0A4Q5IXR4_9ACTN|nr:NERD domain-containing protein/DEAD/DEAH box helicase [Nocardioides iriomotensis]RYU09781.1 nuclease [Nocardioides iriomotensis]